MTLHRTDLLRALESALAKARDSEGRADQPEVREKIRQLIVALEQAVVDVGAQREAQVLGLTKWVADWLPSIDDPLIKALDQVETAAAT